MVNSFDWTFSTVNLQPKRFFFTVFLFRSCCLGVFLFIHSFRLSLPWNSPRSSQKERLHSLSQQLYSLEFGLPFWVITVLKLHLHRKFFLRCTIKASACKITQQSKRRRHWNLPFSKTISMVSLKQSQQYSSTTPHSLAFYIHDWHSYAAFLFINFLNQPTVP